MTNIPKSAPELEGELRALEKEHTKIVEAIHGLRRRTRDATIVATQTHASLNPQEISFWQKGIADNQRQLLEVQATIGAIKKELRARRQKPGTGGYDARRIPAKPESSDTQNEAVDLFTCFYLIARDALPRDQFTALLHNAESLLAEHRRMNNNSP
jgi:hypothetical protein